MFLVWEVDNSYVQRSMLVLVFSICPFRHLKDFEKKGNRLDEDKHGQVYLAEILVQLMWMADKGN